MAGSERTQTVDADKKGKKTHKFFRMSKIRAYLLVKSIKKQLKEQEKLIQLKRMP